MTDRPPAERAELEAEVERQKAVIAALEGVCRNHEGTISVMNEGLRATMAREDILAARVATLTAERDAARRQLEDLAYSHSLCGDLRDECINAETEACAKVLDKLAAEFRAKTGPHHDVDTGDGLAAEIDRAIRARGAK